MASDSSATLILLRHGESEWNALNLFTGWVDVDLTEKGRAEAVRAGELIEELDRQPDVLYTSLLRRAINTANLTLDKADRHWIPVHRDWRLNERHYGALQGLDKAETKAKYGDEQFMAWRRSYDTPPPPIEPGSEYSQDSDPRYADIGGGPLTECLKDVVERFVPYYTGDHRARPAGRQDGADRRPRQLAAGAGEVSRWNVGRGCGGAEHPDRHSAALRPGWRSQTDGHRRHISGSRSRRGGCGGGRGPRCEIARQVVPNGKHWVNRERPESKFPRFASVTCPVLAARCWDDVHRMRTIFA